MVGASHQDLRTVSNVTFNANDGFESHADQNAVDHLLNNSHEQGLAHQGNENGVHDQNLGKDGAKVDTLEAEVRAQLEMQDMTKLA